MCCYDYKMENGSKPPGWKEGDPEPKPHDAPTKPQEPKPEEKGQSARN